jgi:hypothetical protein
MGISCFFLREYLDKRYGNIFVIAMGYLGSFMEISWFFTGISCFFLREYLDKRYGNILTAFMEMSW